MATRGKTVVLESGKRGLLKSGKGAIYDEEDKCKKCCCKIKVLGSFTTNSSNPVWDLTPFQGDHMASPGAYWRLIEMGSCYPGSYPWYGAGCVNSHGRLVGLPNQFRSGYPYNGYMQLQIGCFGENDGHQVTPHIDWPGTCRTPSPVYAC